MGFVWFASCLMACYPYQDAVWLCVCLTVSSFSGAVMDVVVDGLMVIQQRRDPEKGSENL